MERALSALGGRSTLGDAAFTRNGYMELEDRGVPLAAFAHLFGPFGSTIGRDVVMQQAVGFDMSAIEHERLSPEQTGAALAFAALFDLATTVFGSASEAAAWFIRPEIALDGRTPLEASGDRRGRSLIQQILGRLEYGVYT